MLRFPGLPKDKVCSIVAPIMSTETKLCVLDVVEKALECGRGFPDTVESGSSAVFQAALNAPCNLVAGLTVLRKRSLDIDIY